MFVSLYAGPIPVPFGFGRSGVVCDLRSGVVYDLRSGVVHDLRSGVVHDPGSGVVHDLRSGAVYDLRSGVVHDLRSGVVHDLGSGVVYDLRSGVVYELGSGVECARPGPSDPAGLVWRLRPSDTSIALLGHMVAQMPRLEAETEMEIGWINNGGLFIANNRQRFDEYQRLSTIGSALGIENQMLGPSEVHKVSLGRQGQSWRGARL